MAIAAGFLQDRESPQYESGKIVVAAARSDEPIRKEFSFKAATDYLAQGSQAWTEKRQCLACHTNGTFMQLAPLLEGAFDQEIDQQRGFFVAELRRLSAVPASSLVTGLKPTQTAYLANGLASWDANGSGELSSETKQALDLMLQLQSKDGSYLNLACWPPFESSPFHGATVAALALTTAPGYLSQLDGTQTENANRLKRYLQSTPPPHDYARVLLLWVGTQWRDLLTAKQQKELIEMILGHQNTDGGWSIRSFGTPETWGGGVRAQKLRTDPEFLTNPSDGHQTGLAIMVLRDAGLPVSDPAIQAGVAWLKSNQRVSGRWWTRSLNTDRSHFITYSGTFYPLIALQKCGEIKSLATQSSR